MNVQDERILLDEMEIHGYQRAAFFASRIGVAERTIQRRIRSMINRGLIRVVAVLNPVLFRYTVWADIGIHVRPGSLYNVSSRLIGDASIYGATLCHGEFDMMIGVNFDGLDRLAWFANSRLPKVEGILSTETIQLVCLRKYYGFSWPAPPEQDDGTEWAHYRDIMDYNTYQIDEKDRQIVAILMQDGLTSYRGMKTKVGLGESTIHRRVKNMLSKGVFRIEVIPNPKVLPYEAWASIGIITWQRPAHEIIDAILEYPAVYQASECLGRFNLWISARFHSMHLLNHFTRTELPMIKGVTSIATVLHEKPLKYHGINWSYPVEDLSDR